MKEISSAGVYQFTVSTEAGKPVLIISVKSEYKSKPFYTKGLEREYNLNKDLDNPGLFRYLELRDDPDNGKSIVVEWEESRPLATYLHEQHSEEDNEAIFKEVAQTLGYIHSHNQIHGALSPEVIFITEKSGQARVLNFRQHYVDALKEPRDVSRYQSPEAKDNTTSLTASTDIYSLGVLMQDLGLAESHPSVAATCCNASRSSRYSSVDELLYALSHRGSMSTGGGASLPKISRKALVSLLVAVVVIVAVVLVANNWSGLGLNQIGQSAQEDTVNVTANEPVKAATPDTASTTAVADTTSYTGQLEFLATLVPQMKIDIDKIYNANPDKAKARRRVAGYYRGLRHTLKGLNQEQYAAFDKAFADYVNQKNAE